MMNNHFFTVNGVPPIKRRHRHTMKYGSSHSFTDNKTKSDEKRVSDSYYASVGYCRQMFDGPVSVKIEAVYKVPKSWSKKKKEHAISTGFKLTKPDVDNITKAVLDGLNGVAWEDDSSVVALIVTKRYGVDDQTLITIEDLLDL